MRAQQLSLHHHHDSMRDRTDRRRLCIIIVVAVVTALPAAFFGFSITYQLHDLRLDYTQFFINYKRQAIRDIWKSFGAERDTHMH